MLSTQHVTVLSGYKNYPPHTPDYNENNWGGGAKLSQTGTFPGIHGPLKQESQVRIFSPSSVAKLYYVTLNSCQQPYFLNVGNHSAKKEKIQIDKEAKVKDGQSPNQQTSAGEVEEKREP